MSSLDDLRVALFVPSMRGGGAQRMMARLAGGIIERGYQVDLVLLKAEGPYLSELHPEVNVVALGSRRVLTSVSPLARYLKRSRPSAMLSAMRDTNIVALWSKRLTRAKTRLVVREANTLSVSAAGAVSIRGRLLPWLARRFYPWADEIVAVSEGVARDLQRSTGIAPGRISVLQNPVVTPDITSRAAEPAGHDWLAHNGPPVILGVGRLAPQKDFDTLIRAFARLREQTAARLIILGEGPLRGELESLAARLGIADDVAMPGFVRNPYSWMSRAAVFVLSSRWEGFPNVLVESMACGTPVVSTDCPSGPSEILENGAWGPLVPMGDKNALAEAIASTLRNQLHPRDLISRASKFSVAESTKQYLRVMLKTGPGPATAPGSNSGN